MARSASQPPDRSTGPIALKQRAKKALRMHAEGDRGDAVYDKLMELDSAACSKACETLEGLVLCRVLQKLCSKYKISWTQAHHLKSKEKKLGDDVKASSLRIALDATDWTVPIIVNDSSLSTLRGATAVIFINKAEALKLLEELSPQDASLAVVHEGCPLPGIMRAEKILIPVLEHVAGVGPRKTYKPGTIYNFGLVKILPVNAPVIVIADESEEVVWIRITIHEADASATFAPAFKDQFNGAAPISAVHTGSRKATPGPRQRPKRTDAKKLLDDSLSVLIIETMAALASAAKPQSPATRLFRAGTGDKRDFGCVMAFTTGAAEKLLPLSGCQGITLQVAFGGDVEAAIKDRENFDVVWYTKGQVTLKQAYEQARLLKSCQGAFYGHAKQRIGIRVKKGPDASAVWQAVTGSTTSTAGRRWRMTGLPNNFATKTQAKNVVDLMKWSAATVDHVHYSSKEKCNVAVICSENAPPSAYVQVSSKLCNIEEIKARAIRGEDIKPSVIVHSDDLARRKITGKSRPVMPPPAAFIRPGNSPTTSTTSTTGNSANVRNALPPTPAPWAGVRFEQPDEDQDNMNLSYGGAWDDEEEEEEEDGPSLEEDWGGPPVDGDVDLPGSTSDWDEIDTQPPPQPVPPAADEARMTALETRFADMMEEFTKNSKNFEAFQKTAETNSLRVDKDLHRLAVQAEEQVTAMQNVAKDTGDTKSMMQTMMEQQKQFMAQFAAAGAASSSTENLESGKKARTA
jgi:hypothetical protein